MADRPAPGTFRMYAQVIPDTPAGSYVLTGDVTLPGPVEQLQTHVEVVSPRFVMPPEQILSTYPPAKSRGAYSSRLPQIVLRRRTLPWERPHGPGDARPWLALVLLAEGEGELKPDATVDQCVTPGTALAGPPDAPRGAYVEVPESVLDRVFPTQEDIGLLAHVREVDIADTELMMGDDDGWMAVVLANRLPRPGVTYLAVLVSLEGQVDVLPRDADVQTELDDLLAVDQVLDLRILAAASGAGGGAVRATSDDVALGHVVASSAALAPHGLGGSPVGVQRSVAVPAQAADAGWAVKGPSASALSTAGGAVVAEGVAVRREMASQFAFPAVLALQPTYRFPALAFWSFTCEGDGDFRSLALGVDVGLLGEVRPGAAPPDPPADAPPQAGTDLPTDPRTVRSTETGHVALAHLTRRGDSTAAWFRGPLAPQPVDRVQPDADGHLPLAHDSDQVRIVTPDGREDLSYAAAFEIGRLLALSQPAVVAALARWRQEAYGAARVQALGDQLVSSFPAALGAALLAPDHVAAATATGQAAVLGSRVARGLVDLLSDNAGAVAPARPPVDPGAPAVTVKRLGDDATVAGLGIAEVPVRGTDPDVLAAALRDAPVARADTGPADDPATYTALRSAVEEAAGAAAGSAAPAGGPPATGGRTPGAPGPQGARSAARPVRRGRHRDTRDALDDLLDEASRRRQP